MRQIQKIARRDTPVRVHQPLIRENAVDCEFFPIRLTKGRKPNPIWLVPKNMPNFEKNDIFSKLGSECSDPGSFKMKKTNLISFNYLSRKMNYLLCISSNTK